MGIFSLFKKKEKSHNKPSYKPMTPDEMGLPELDNPDFGPELSKQNEFGRLKQDFDLPQRPDFNENQNFEPSASPLNSYRPPNAHAQPNQNHSSRDIDLVLSKLDAIRSILTNLDLRISNLEKVAGTGKNNRRYQW